MTRASTEGFKPKSVNTTTFRFQTHAMNDEVRDDLSHEAEEGLFLLTVVYTHSFFTAMPCPEALRERLFLWHLLLYLQKAAMGESRKTVVSTCPLSVSSAQRKYKF